MLAAIKKALRTDPFLDKPLPIGLAANSAVLVPLFERSGDTGMLLIHRSSDGSPHSGQMGFPGGMTNPGDGGDLLRTALRESEEELGIDPGEVRIIGELILRPTVVSGLVVKPYVGIIPWPCTLVPDPKEVQGTHITTIGHLQREVMPGHNPFNLPPPVYPVDGRPVWGVTAKMVTELLGKLDRSI